MINTRLEHSSFFLNFQVLLHKSLRHFVDFVVLKYVTRHVVLERRENRGGSDSLLHWADRHRSRNEARVLVTGASGCLIKQFDRRETRRFKSRDIENGGDDYGRDSDWERRPARCKKPSQRALTKRRKLKCWKLELGEEVGHYSRCSVCCST